MENKTEDTIVEIMSGLNNEDVSHDVEMQRIEPADVRLKNKLLDLVSGQVGEIAKLDRIISKGLTSLEDRIVLNELSAQDTLNVINTLSNKKIDLTTAILDPFKAAPGGTSPLLPPAKEKDDNTDLERGLKEMSPEQLKVVEKLFRVLQANENQ